MGEKLWFLHTQALLMAEEKRREGEAFKEERTMGHAFHTCVRISGDDWRLGSPYMSCMQGCKIGLGKLDLQYSKISSLHHRPSLCQNSPFKMLSGAKREGVLLFLILFQSNLIKKKKNHSSPRFKTKTPLSLN